MVSQHQTKNSGSKKNGDKELGMVAPQDKSSKEMKSSKKMKFASSSAETEPTSQTTISNDSKTGRGMSTMPRVVKRKLQKLRPIVEYNKRGKGIGQAHSEMQSYIGVLARSRVPLVDKKWSQIPKDIKEQIWEAVDMAFVVGQGGKNSVLAFAAKKWKDFKSTLTRHYILPYTNDKEKLSQPPETYKFIEKAQWDAFVASRLSKDFESVHSQHAQIREKLEYNHRLSRKGYAGLEDQLEETMPGVEIDRSTLWKRARQDKHGNIPDPKDELQKQVSEGKVSVHGSNDVLTMALGPEHPGRLRGVGAGISPRQYFNLPKPQRVSFDDRLKESLRVLLQEETKKMEAKAREETLRMESRTKQLEETLSSRYSCWPVILVTYNLPPWLYMKRKFMMLTLLISGPKQPGNDIDVYLEPLIDDLKSLWVGIRGVYDAHNGEYFTLRAALMWTINDFPAYGNLSGCVVKGYKACPICGDDTPSHRLKNGHKICYIGHRKWLPINHPYRRQRAAFNGKPEYGIPPEPLTGEEVLHMVENGGRVCWKKKSIFFDLEYWKYLPVRHALDVMHIEKNVCDSIIGTLLEIPEKIKMGLLLD
ncbi:hypothetical protein L3X38_034036 [Prunus dulcis]|uniref:Uncharacterized protein n=1 Tax=Prunus dulcis TaxID=3755 RepID=A0AAD4VHC7_PRUDU|nr:hypothetical protein L3X38_034036 [Prunus dulcis]